MYYEKGYNLIYSINKAVEILKKLNIEYEIVQKDIDIHSFSTVAIKSSRNEIIASGKGIGLQVLASGLFETIEHYYFEHFRIEKNLRCLKIEDIINQSEKIKKMLPIKLLKRDFCVLCKEIQSVQGDKTIWFPKFLLENPQNNFDSIPSYALKYVTNNGLAVGLSREECLIHAINEIIERESVSKHIQDIFFDFKKDKIKVVKKSSLPKEILVNLNKLEKILGNSVNILDVTQYEGFYTFYVYINDCKKPLPLKASATSQCPFIALNRALSELYQVYELYDDEEYNQDKLCLEKFQNYRNFFNAVSCNYEHCEIEKTNFDSTKIFRNGSLSVQFKMLNDYITKHSMDVFEYRYDTEKDIYCSKIIVLGVDNFQLINHGVAVIPMDREGGD